LSRLNVCSPHSWGTRVSLLPWHMNKGGTVMTSCGMLPRLCNRQELCNPENAVSAKGGSYIFSISEPCPL
jgi:hypothetical protein